MRELGWLLREPWSLLNVDEPDARVRLEHGGSYDVDGASTVHLVVPATSQASPYVRREKLPTVSAPFMFGDWGDVQHLILPAGSELGSGSASRYDFEERFRIEEGSSRRAGEILLRQSGAVSRPLDRSGPEAHDPDFPEKEPPSETNELLADFVDWQVGCFQELLDIEFEYAPALEVEIGRDYVRRGWNACRAAWLERAPEHDPARMALIVTLARDATLIRCLEKLCRRPRRILERYRGKEHLGRIQQMDAACLRWFSRQPGHTPAEKAGPSQQLLAVKRREMFDTLENKVLNWVLEGMRRLATRYLRANAKYRGAGRCQEVKRLEAELLVLLRSEPICDVPARLPSPLVPNYPLLQNPDYRLVWSTYRRLKANLREEEETWRWQRMLWKETCGQLVCSVLTKPDFSEGLGEIYPSSTVYFRHETQWARRTEGPSTPGPFRHRNQDLDLVDPREGPPPKGLCDWLGPLGGDMALLSRDPQGRVTRGCAMWFLHDWSENVDLKARLDRCASALRVQAEHDALLGKTPLPLDGLLLVNEPPDASTPGTVEVDLAETGYRDGRVVLIRIPTDLHAPAAAGAGASPAQGTEDFIVGIQMALEALLP